jgi:hypothetical protein
LEIFINRENKITIKFEDNTELEVVDQIQLDEIHLWYINKKGEVINLSPDK